MWSLIRVHSFQVVTGETWTLGETCQKAVKEPEWCWRLFPSSNVWFQVSLKNSSKILGQSFAEKSKWDFRATQDNSRQQVEKKGKMVAYRLMGVSTHFLLWPSAFPLSTSTRRSLALNTRQTGVGPFWTLVPQRPSRSLSGLICMLLPSNAQHPNIPDFIRNQKKFISWGPWNLNSNQHNDICKVLFAL